MGNHAVGLAMGRLAEEMIDRRHPNESALDLLDKICGPYRNSDAEFESADPENPTQTHPKYDQYTDPDGPIGRLIKEAFAPDFPDPVDDDDWESWFDGPYGEFRKRYEFY